MGRGLKHDTAIGTIKLDPEDVVKSNQRHLIVYLIVWSKEKVAVDQEECLKWR